MRALHFGHANRFVSTSQAEVIQSSERHAQEQGVASGYRRRRAACTPRCMGDRRLAWRCLAPPAAG